MKKKILSWALLLCMVLTLLPFSALAVDESPFAYQPIDGKAIIHGYNGEPVKDLVIPEKIGDYTVTELHSGVIGRSGAESLQIPAGVTKIDPGALFNTTLKSIKVDEGNANYVVKDGDLLTKDGKTLVLHPSALTDAAKVPAGVTTIGGYAYDNSKAASILIGSDVTTLAYGAIQRASAIKSISLPDSVTTLEAATMRDCKALEQVAFSENLKAIPDAALMNDPALKSVYIPASVESIVANAIPGNVKDIYFGGTEAQWNAITIKDTPSGHKFLDGKDVAVHYNHKHTFNKAAEAIVGANGEKMFACTECGKLVLSFTDVPENEYYSDAVAWAVSKSITNGMGNNLFAPNDTCKRGQIVTFLWRAAGKPTAKDTTNPFTDVKADDYFYDAVLWAVEKGITKGTSDTTFSPNDGCTRGQVVTFLWRYAGETKAENVKNPFTDVAAGEYYSDAVLWAVDLKIAKGMTETTFEPATTCTRGQIVTFLYRDLVENAK